MSLDTVKRIAELLRAARTEGAGDDPAYFDRKAEVFDAMAREDPRQAVALARFAEVARARARELRGAAEVSS